MNVFMQQEGGSGETAVRGRTAMPGELSGAARYRGLQGLQCSSNYNSRPLLPERCLIGVARPIRRRQTIEELLRLELL
ncbi:hypothetical protein ACNKHO_17815 [Shigella flexneri]